MTLPRIHEDPFLASFRRSVDDVRRHRGYPCGDCTVLREELAVVDDPAHARALSITLEAHEEMSHMTEPRRPLEVVPTHPSTNRPAWVRWTRIAAVTTVALVVWSIQYTVAVPTWACWRALVWLLRGAGKVGLVGVLLLLLPVIGWIILAVLLVMRHGQRDAERRHRETMAAMGRAVDPPDAEATVRRARILEPWFLPVVRDAWAAA